MTFTQSHFLVLLLNYTIEGLHDTVRSHMRMILPRSVVSFSYTRTSPMITLEMPKSNLQLHTSHASWGSSCKLYLDKIFKLQKWAIRMISNGHHRSHTWLLFFKHNILDVNDTYKLNIGMFMYNIILISYQVITSLILLDILKNTTTQPEMPKNIL